MKFRLFIFHLNQVRIAVVKNTRQECWLDVAKGETLHATNGRGKWCGQVDLVRELKTNSTA